MRWMIVLALAACGPRIELPIESDSASGTSAGEEAEAEADESGDDPSDTVATTGDPEEPFAAEVVVLRFDPNLGQQWPVALDATRLDGSETVTLAEMPPLTVGARFLGVQSDQTVVLADIDGTAPSEAVFADYVGNVAIVQGIDTLAWLAADGSAVWSSEIDGVALRPKAGEVQWFTLDAAAEQMSASRRWAWTGSAARPATLHDLDGAFPSITIDHFTRETDDPLCGETVHPGIWTSVDGSMAMAFPDPAGALLRRSTDGGEWMGVETYAHLAVGYDTCQDALRLYAEDGTLYAYSMLGTGIALGSTAALVDPVFAFSPDGRYALGVGRLEDNNAALVVFDTQAGFANPLSFAPTGTLVIGMVGNTYATILYFPLSEEPSYTAYRLELANNAMVEVPHCGDFAPRVLDDGRMLVCDREGALGNTWGLQVLGGDFTPLGQDGRDVRVVPPAGTPAACVDTGVLPRVLVICE